MFFNIACFITYSFTLADDEIAALFTAVANKYNQNSDTLRPTITHNLLCSVFLIAIKTRVADV
jgi:hypothetical protein